jgi:hypothetical protein
VNAIPSGTEPETGPEPEGSASDRIVLGPDYHPDHTIQRSDLMRIPKRVAVIGAGSMGSQAMWRLAARGAEVIGYDRYAPGHDRGAAGGESRIFRAVHLGEPAAFRCCDSPTGCGSSSRRRRAGRCDAAVAAW